MLVWCLATVTGIGSIVIQLWIICWEDTKKPAIIYIFNQISEMFKQLVFNKIISKSTELWNINFTHLKLCFATANHNLKWVKITHIWLIWENHFEDLDVWTLIAAVIKVIYSANQAD